MCNGSSNPANMVTIPSYTNNVNANRLDEYIRQDERVNTVRRYLHDVAVQAYKKASEHTNAFGKPVSKREDAEYMFSNGIGTDCASIEVILRIMGTSVSEIMTAAVEIVDGVPF